MAILNIFLYPVIFLLLFCNIISVNANEIPITTDSRIKTLVYNVNEIHQLKFHYGYQSYIEFAEGEKIETISVGEPFAWKLTPMGQRLFVRALEISAHTNMTLITNKRTYHFDIKSGEYDGKIDEELVYVVRFYYPEIIEEVVKTPPIDRTQEMQSSRTSSVPIVNKPLPAKRNKYLRVDSQYDEILQDGSKRNFDYKIVGYAGDIMPLKIFNDASRTYFQFKNNNLIIPSIFVVDAFGGERPVNYIIEEDFVVIDSVELQFSLRLSNSLLCVFNENLE